MVIPHATLARTGNVRAIPLAMGVEGDGLLVFANDGGAPGQPRLVLQSEGASPHPRIDVEMGTERFRAAAYERGWTCQKRMTRSSGGGDWPDGVEPRWRRRAITAGSVIGTTFTS